MIKLSKAVCISRDTINDAIVKRRSIIDFAHEGLKCFKIFKCVLKNIAKHHVYISVLASVGAQTSIVLILNIQPNAFHTAENLRIKSRD